MGKGFILGLLIFLRLPFGLQAQDTNEVEAVRKVITTLFEGMRGSDTTIIRELIYPKAQLMTSAENISGVPLIVQGGGLKAWLEGVAAAPVRSLDEQLDYIDIMISSDRMATAWTPYRFYLNGKLSHCGVNSFQLAKNENRWFITSIIDTRNKKECDDSKADWNEKTISSLNAKLDQWHADAATGNFDQYFGAMTEASVFIGTDETEVWDKKTFMEFSQPHFEDGKGWDFSSKRRSWYFSKDKQIAWFDEELDTWMGVCRGSGVFEQTNDGWKLAHYVLSMTVPNEKVNDVISLIKNE